MVHDGIGDFPALIADLGIKTVWIPQAEAVLDVQVANIDAVSYVGQSVSAVLANAEEEKNTSICLLLSYAMPFLLLLHSVVHVYL